jgi:DNA-binding transcriptional LysR family regulator
MNTRSPDLSHLRLLLVLLETLNVTRAANRLNTTQPAISNKLRDMRAIFNDPLFVPRQRGLIPTARAVSIGLDVAPVIRALDMALAPRSFDPAQVQATFRIAATDYAVQVTLLPAIERLRRVAPGINVSILQPDPPRLGELLETSALDLALTIAESAPEALKRRTVLTEQYVLAAAINHPILSACADGRAPKLDVACELDYVLVSPGGGSMWGTVDDVLRARDRQRRIRVSVPNFLAAMELVARTDLVAVLPRRLVAGIAGRRLTARPFPLKIPSFDLLAVWHPRSHADPLHKFARNILLDSGAELA